MGDRYENKVKIEEINSLVKEGALLEAADIADTVDWTTIKNIPILCKVSDIYKAIKRYEDSRDVLYNAYEKQPSRPIVKSLCELSIALGDLVNAIEFFKEFVQIAPKDPGKFVLQYKIYKAQNVNLEEQIEVLENIRVDGHYLVDDKWAYELATLYYRAGMTNKCVEECDNIILWLVDGKYVIKAYELKSQIKPLTESEIYRYELLRQSGGSLNIQYSLREDEEPPKQEPKEFAIGSDVSPYNTQNLQAVVAQGIQEMFEPDASVAPTVSAPTAPLTYEQAVALDEEALGNQSEEDQDLMMTQMYNPVIPEAPVGQELERDEESSESSETSFSDTDIIGDVSSQMAAQMLNNVPEYVIPQNTDEIKPITGEIPTVSFEKPEDKGSEITENVRKESKEKDPINNTGVIETFHKGSSFDGMLSQGYDGQISFIVPETPTVDTQITGQISLDDIMKEWEKKKRDAEAKREADVKDRVRQQADVLFKGFDEATKSDLVKQIEETMINASKKEEHDRIVAERPKQIKVADINKADEGTASLGTVSILRQILEEEGEVPEGLLENAPETKETPKAEASKKEEPKAESKVEEKKPEVKEAPEKKEPEAESKVEEKKPEVKEASEKKEPKAEPKAEEKEPEFEAEPEIEEPETEGSEEEFEEESEAEEVKNPLRANRQMKGRDLTSSEMEQFAAFVRRRSTQRQLANVLDNVTLASYTGNVLIAAEEDIEVTTFSKLLIQEIQNSDSNFTGKVALVSAESLNKKEISAVLEKVKNGALIISEPHLLKKKTVESLISELNKDGIGIVILIQGRGDILDKLLEQNEGLRECFNLRVDLEAFDAKTLVEYAKTYAYEREYSFDELGELALYTRISDMQTADHDVTLSEIEEFVDEAIYYADRKTPSHFFDVLFGKRYNEEDMIVLREKDFMHY